MWRLYPVGVFLGSFFSIHELPLGIDYNVMSVLHHDVSKEARAGIEPANSGFADRCLTTWLPRRKSVLSYFPPYSWTRRRISLWRKTIRAPRRYPCHPKPAQYTPCRR